MKRQRYPLYYRAIGNHDIYKVRRPGARLQFWSYQGMWEDAVVKTDEGQLYGYARRITYKQARRLRKGLS